MGLKAPNAVPACKQPDPSRPGRNTMDGSAHSPLPLSTSSHSTRSASSSVPEMEVSSPLSHGNSQLIKQNTQHPALFSKTQCWAVGSSRGAVVSRTRLRTAAKVLPLLAPSSAARRH